MTTSEQAEAILRDFGTDKNILLLGPPASGKSMLMAEIARQFIGSQNTIATVEADQPVPIPSVQINEIPNWLPSPDRENRKVFHITFHQGTKHRDFVSGIVPNLQNGQTGFRVVDGILMAANRHAMAGGTSLILIDEMNRGPAVAIFGDTLTAIETDKRLDNDDNLLHTSVPFKVFDSQTSEITDVYLSPHVYLLASMNEADTSVEALDIAFLRRFKSKRLYPSEKVIKEALGIVDFPELPADATDRIHIITALIKAWNKINERITLGKGAAFQIGHGIIIGRPQPQDLGQAKIWAVDCWKSIDSLVKELFYGNDESMGVVFNAKPGNNYRLDEMQFGEESIEKLMEPIVTPENIYEILCEIVN